MNYNEYNDLIRSKISSGDMNISSNQMNEANE